jgi:deoxycytidine triphosphate deaminase
MTLYARKTQNALVDSELVALAAEGKVITAAFEAKQLSGCAYDLRAGDSLTSRQRGQQFDLTKEPFVVESGEVVTIRSMEELNYLDPLCCGLILTSHTQLSQGVFHPTTSVDPGFVGPLTITLINLGTTGYSIRRGDRIAKLITSPVSPTPDRIYGKGQKPRVVEGSLEHSLVVVRASASDEELESDEFFGGPLRNLAERVRVLEDDAELHRTKKENRRIRFVLMAIWTLVSAVMGGSIVKYGDVVWKWATSRQTAAPATVPQAPPPVAPSKPPATDSASPLPKLPAPIRP